MNLAESSHEGVFHLPNQKKKSLDRETDVSAEIVAYPMTDPWNEEVYLPTNLP